MIKELYDFIEYCNEYKSSNTVRAYKKDIEQFLEYLKMINENISTLSFQHIEDYKDYMINQMKLNVKSINRKIVAIHEFLTYSQIAVTVKPLKIQTQNFLEDIFSSDEVQRIIHITELNNDYRAKALILTLELTGTRISECLQIQLSDIKQDSVNVIGKGQKRRNIFIPKKLQNVWQEYLPYRIKKSNALFTGRQGAISRKTGYNIVRKYGILAGIDKKKVHPHNFRHYYIKSLLAHNVEITSVSDLVGHSDINVTRQYARKTKKELLDIINDI